MKKLFIIISILTFPLFLFANPAVYEYSKNYSRQAFFNDNYRETWNKLSDRSNAGAGFFMPLCKIDPAIFHEISGLQLKTGTKCDTLFLLVETQNKLGGRL